MSRRLIIFLVACTLLLAGLPVVPVLGEASGDAEAAERRGPPPRAADAREAREERLQERQEARERFLGEKREARENFTDVMRQTGERHRDCVRNATDDNASARAASIQACHLEAREQLFDLRVEARTHFLAAMQRAKETYHDRLAANRAGFLDVEATDGCAASPPCVERRIGHFEARLAHAEGLRDAFAARYAMLQERQQQVAAEGNATRDDLYRLHGSLHGLQVRLDLLDQSLARLTEALATWNAHKDAFTE